MLTKTFYQFCILNILKTVSSTKSYALLSSVRPDGSIRTTDGNSCVSTIFGLTGNSHLELVDCVQYGKESITYDMKFSYDTVKKTLTTGGNCLNINENTSMLNIKPCRNAARHADPKQSFHVMRNETSRVLVPGGQYAGMCVGYENSDAQFSEGMKLVTVFDCDMSEYVIES